MDAKSNAGKIVLVAVLLLVAVGYYGFRGEQAPSRSGDAQFVCVATGKIFWLERKPRTFPVENPETGQATLLPCYEDESGQLLLAKRCRPLLAQLDKNELNQYVDSKTLVVRTSP